MGRDLGQLRPGFSYGWGSRPPVLFVGEDIASSALALVSGGDIGHLSPGFSFGWPYKPP